MKQKRFGKQIYVSKEVVEYLDRVSGRNYTEKILTILALARLIKMPKLIPEKKSKKEDLIEYRKRKLEKEKSVS